jgi:hypothetical protein
MDELGPKCGARRDYSVQGPSNKEVADHAMARRVSMWDVERLGVTRSGTVDKEENRAVAQSGGVNQRVRHGCSHHAGIKNPNEIVVAIVVHFVAIQ